MAARFIHSQLFVTPPTPTESYTGKTILITGSNTGLGLEAARHFTRLGASTVVLAVRSIEKGEAAKRDIEATTGRANVVKVMHLDMSSYQSVLDFATQASQELKRIDIAILNAGVNRRNWELFEAHESSITVNVISTFLLVFALLPKLIETSKTFNTSPTLTVTASEVHEFADFTERHAPPGRIFSRLSEPVVDGKSVDLGNRYQVSKLLQVLAAREMCGRYPTTQMPVTVNFVNPGLCKSELSRECGWGMYILQTLLGRTAEVGSRTLVHAGSLGPQSHGEYVSDCELTKPAVWVLSEEGRETQKRVWEELVGTLETIKGGVTRL